MAREFLGNIKGPKGDKGDSRTYGGGINLLPESDSRHVVKDEGTNFVRLRNDGLPAGSYVISFDYEIVKEAEDITSFLLYQGSSVASIPLTRVDGRARLEITVSSSQVGSPLYLYGNRNASSSRPNEVVFKEIMIEHGSVSSLNYTPSEEPPADYENLFSMSREVWKYANNKVNYNYQEGIISFSNAIYQYRYEVNLRPGEHILQVEDIINPDRPDYANTVTAQLRDKDGNAMRTIGVMGERGGYSNTRAVSITEAEANTNNGKFHIQFAVTNSGRISGRIVRPKLFRGTHPSRWSLSAEDNLVRVGTGLKVGTRNLVNMSKAETRNASNHFHVEPETGTFHFSNTAYGFRIPMEPLKVDAKYIIRVDEVHNPDWVSNTINIILARKDGSSTGRYLWTTMNNPVLEFSISQEEIDDNGGSNEFMLSINTASGTRIAGYFRGLMVAEGDHIGSYNLSYLDQVGIGSVYKVPSDFATLQEAVDHASSIPTKQGAQVEVLIESGYRPSRGISVSDGNYNDIIIRSEDSTVTVATNYSGVFLECSNANAPVIDCLIDAQDRGGDGFRYTNSSSGVILRDAGIENAGGTGLYVQSSHVTAMHAILRRANNRAIWFTRGATGSVGSVDASYTKGGNVAVYASRGSSLDASSLNVSHANVGSAAVYAIRSIINFINGNASYAKARGIHCTQSSLVSCRDTNLSNCGSNAISSYLGGNVNLGGTTNDLSNSGSDAIHAHRGGTVSGSGVIATGASGRAIVAEDTARVSVTELTSGGSGLGGIRAENGSTVYIGPDSVIENTSATAVFASGGSSIHMEGATVRNAGTHGVRLEGGSRLAADGATITGSSGDGLTTMSLSQASVNGATITGSSLFDIRINSGSQVAARNATLSNGVVPQTSNISVSAYDTMDRNGAVFS